MLPASGLPLQVALPVPVGLAPVARPALHAWTVQAWGLEGAGPGVAVLLKGQYGQGQRTLASPAPEAVVAVDRW